MLKVVLSTVKANIYDMSRSHEGRNDKQHIVQGNTSLYLHKQKMTVWTRK